MDGKDYEELLEDNRPSAGERLLRLEILIKELHRKHEYHENEHQKLVKYIGIAIVVGVAILVGR